MEVVKNKGKKRTRSILLGIPKAPQHLSNSSRNVWRQVFQKWEVDGPTALVLQTALEAFDEIQECRRIIAADGAVLTNPKTKAQRPNPAIAQMRSARAAFLQATKVLNLEPEDKAKQAPGRPASVWYPEKK